MHKTACAQAHQKESISIGIDSKERPSWPPQERELQYWYETQEANHSSIFVSHATQSTILGQQLIHLKAVHIRHVKLLTALIVGSASFFKAVNVNRQLCSVCIYSLTYAVPQYTLLIQQMKQIDVALEYPFFFCFHFLTLFHQN